MLKSKSVFVTEANHGERLDVAATALFRDISRKRIKSLIDRGGLYVNKKRILFAKVPVKKGDRIEIFWDEPSDAQQKTRQQSVHSSSFLGVPLSREILVFENDDFFVVNKPAGIPCQATLVSSRDTLLHALNAFDAKTFPMDKMFMVHRLDKETSGLFLIAKQRQSQQVFETLFKERKIEKHYLALCHNVPKVFKGVIDFPICKDPARNNGYLVLTQKTQTGLKARHAKTAQTEYAVSQVFRGGEASLVFCVPKTGRTHQVRVHLSALGCPIVGDKTYSLNVYGRRFGQRALRHMLHATLLRFCFAGQEYEFRAPLPADFQAVLRDLDPGWELPQEMHGKRGAS